MLAGIGVQVVTSSVRAGDYFDKYITPGNFDLAALAWAGSPFPVSSMRPLYAKPTKDADGNLVILQNFARIGSAELDAKLDEAIAELDPVKARELANQADQLIWQEVHSLPLYQQPQIRACDAKLANFGANGFQSIAYEDIGFTK
jgi:peptide/nickel transport system substrate-binding protein